MTPAWAQRREEMLSDCLISPDVFTHMVDRLGEFVVPYRQALETAADPHPMHLYLQGLLSHVAPRMPRPSPPSSMSSDRSSKTSLAPLPGIISR